MATSALLTAPVAASQDAAMIDREAAKLVLEFVVLSILGLPVLWVGAKIAGAPGASWLNCTKVVLVNAAVGCAFALALAIIFRNWPGVVGFLLMLPLFIAGFWIAIRMAMKFLEIGFGSFIFLLILLVAVNWILDFVLCKVINCEGI